jgi:hypothetical protein
MRKKQSFLKLRLRFLGFSLDGEMKREESQSGDCASDGPVIDGDARKADLQNTKLIGSSQSFPVENTDSKKQAK